MNSEYYIERLEEDHRELEKDMKALAGVVETLASAFADLYVKQLESRWKGCPFCNADISQEEYSGDWGEHEIDCLVNVAGRLSR